MTNVGDDVPGLPPGVNAFESDIGAGLDAVTPIVACAEVIPSGLPALPLGDMAPVAGKASGAADLDVAVTSESFCASVMARLANGESATLDLTSAMPDLMAGKNTNTNAPTNKASPANTAGLDSCVHIDVPGASPGERNASFRPALL